MKGVALFQLLLLLDFSSIAAAFWSASWSSWLSLDSSSANCRQIVKYSATVRSLLVNGKHGYCVWVLSFIVRAAGIVVLPSMTPFLAVALHIGLLISSSKCRFLNFFTMAVGLWSSSWSSWLSLDSSSNVAPPAMGSRRSVRPTMKGPCRTK